MDLLCKLRDINKLIRDFEVYFHDKYGLSINEGMLLCSLRSEDLSSGNIAGILGLTTSNASKVICSAESKGLIERIMGKEDKRQMYFHITDTGKEMLKNIEAEQDSIESLLCKIKN